MKWKRLVHSLLTPSESLGLNYPGCKVLQPANVSACLFTKHPLLFYSCKNNALQ